MHHLTELGNSHRFVERYGEMVRYCYEWNKWLIWDSKRWKPDRDGKIMDYAKQTVQAMYAELPRVPKQQIGEFMSHVKRSEGKTKLQNMLYLAQDAVAILPEKLDGDPYALNCENGTLDLESGELNAHWKEDYITKLIPVFYLPAVECPKWLEFLNTVMDGDREMINYLQRCVGYSLSGMTGEQCLFMLVGDGGNGKSTFLEVIRGVLGDYAKHANFSTFLEAKFDDPIRNDIARLRGARLVTAVETERDRKAAEVLIKQMTGGDTVTARHLYSEAFEFIPQCKIWWAVNHKPIIAGQDYAIWRRIKPIEFTVTIRPENQVKDYAQKLLREEIYGIFSWCVEGTKLWLESGLQEPNRVRNANTEYRNEMDLLGDFIAACCELKKGARITKNELYGRYESWCEETGEEPANKKAFGSCLKGRGLFDMRTGTVRYWVGIRLR